MSGLEAAIAKRARKAAKRERDGVAAAEGRWYRRESRPLAFWDRYCGWWIGPFLPGKPAYYVAPNTAVEPRWRQRLLHRRSLPMARTWRDSRFEERYDYSAPGVVVDQICGFCPVQGYGSVDGQAWYFHARGSAWTLRVGPVAGKFGLPEPVEWGCEAGYGPPYSAGWMSAAHVRKCLDAAFKAYRMTSQEGGWRELVGNSVPRGPERWRP